jgi:hypothetical protein
MVKSGDHVARSPLYLPKPYKIPEGKQEASVKSSPHAFSIDKRLG